MVLGNGHFASSWCRPLGRVFRAVRRGLERAVRQPPDGSWRSGRRRCFGGVAGWRACCNTSGFQLQCAAFFQPARTGSAAVSAAVATPGSIDPGSSSGMPIYEYRCEACGAELEKLQKISDPPLRDCPECSRATLVKQVSASSFRLKGSGWYETDFKTGKKKNGVADSTSDSGAGAGKSTSGAGSSAA